MTAIARENLDYAWRNVAWATVCEHIDPQLDWEKAWIAFSKRAEKLREWNASNIKAEYYTDGDGDSYWIMNFEKDGSKWST